MGASHANATPPLLDASPWPLEEAGEDAVLAEFADETKLASGGAIHELSAEPPAVVSARAPSSRSRRWRDMVRTLVLGCLSAMALGASFAIGFGYVWSDRASLLAIPDTAETSESTSRPYVPGWWLALPPAAPALDAAKAPAGPPAPIHPSTVRAPAAPNPPTASRKSAPAAVTPVKAPNLPSTGVTLLDERGTSTTPTAETTGTTRSDPVPASVSDQPGILPSRALAPGDIPSAPTRQSLVSAGFDVAARTPRTSVIAAIPPDVAPTPTANRADVDAVRHTIALYQSAYSQMDIGAMAAVWPSLDTASVERAFASVDRQALTLHECRVTTAGDLATAVCPGQVRYVGRVGGRQMQERRGTWTIALERRGDAWQFVRLNAR